MFSRFNQLMPGKKNNTNLKTASQKPKPILQKPQIKNRSPLDSLRQKVSQATNFVGDKYEAFTDSPKWVQTVVSLATTVALWHGVFPNSPALDYTNKQIHHGFDSLAEMVQGDDYSSAPTLNPETQRRINLTQNLVEAKSKYTMSEAINPDIKYLQVQNWQVKFSEEQLNLLKAHINYENATKEGSKGFVKISNTFDKDTFTYLYYKSGILSWEIDPITGKPDLSKVVFDSTKM